MPPVIIAAAAAAATYAAYDITGYYVLSALIGMATATILGKSFYHGNGVNEMQARLQVVKSAIAPRRVIYGESMVSGVMIFAATNDGSGNVDTYGHPISQGYTATTVTMTVLDWMNVGANQAILQNWDGASPINWQGDAAVAAGGTATTFQFSGDSTVYTVAEFQSMGQSPQFSSSLFPVLVSFRPALAKQTSVNQSTTLTYSKISATTGNANQYLHSVLMLAGHQITTVTEVYFGEFPFTDPRFAPGSDGTNYYHFEFGLGAPGQTANSDLVAQFPGMWTTSCKLTGCAYIYLKLSWNANVWPTGFPTVKCLVKGKPIYDPRQDPSQPGGNPSGTQSLTNNQTWQWSNNWALCILDYLMDTDYGLGSTASEINFPSFIVAANVCDEQVVIDSEGTTQARYTCDGTFTMDSTPVDTLESMLAAGAGGIVYIQGQWQCFPGIYRTPTQTLTISDLRGQLEVTPHPSRRDLYNAVRGGYTDPANDWQLSDFVPVVNNTYFVEDGSEWIYHDIQLAYTTDPVRAQRLAKIVLEKSRNSINVVFPAKLTCLNITPFDTVYLDIPALGWSNMVFQVVHWALAAEGGVDLILQQESSSAYDWNLGDGSTVTNAGNTTLQPSWNIYPPTQLVMSEFVYIDQNGGFASQIKCTWQPSIDGRLYQYLFQYAQTANGPWTSVNTTQTSYTLMNVSPGAYYVRVCATNLLNQQSAFATANLTLSGSHPLASAVGLPDPVSPLVFATANADGSVSKARITLGFAEEFSQMPDGLLLMYSVTPQPNQFVVGTDSGQTLTVGSASAYYISPTGFWTVQATSTPSQVFVVQPTNPLPLDVNWPGQWWAQVGTSQWRVVTSYDATSLYFNEPLNYQPQIGDQVTIAEVSWIDKRSSDFRLAYCVNPAGQVEIIRWGDITESGGVFELTGVQRGLEGTSEINLAGATVTYFPAPGLGTTCVNIPLASWRPYNGGYVADMDVDVTIPRGWSLAMSCVVYRQRPDSGFIRSDIVPVNIGGLL